MNILALDTSAKSASVSILNEQKVLAEYTVNVNLTHSQTILPMCEHILSCCNIPLEEIDYFAVSNGPGSFTGLRIGIAAVKGFAFAAQKPCIAVSTLEALSYNVSDFTGTVCCVMDARCHQVYNALFSFSPAAKTRLCADRAISLEALQEELLSAPAPILLVGDGADLCYNEYQSKIPGIQICSVPNRYQRASSVGMAAWEKIRAGQSFSASELMPEYLRLPQAQRELIKKRRSTV
jgi:tRNA threonylcarbamoyladenosine biosynthesis protein TsaB